MWTWHHWLRVRSRTSFWVWRCRLPPCRKKKRLKLTKISTLKTSLLRPSNPPTSMDKRLSQWWPVHMSSSSSWAELTGGSEPSPLPACIWELITFTRTSQMIWVSLILRRATHMCCRRISSRSSSRSVIWESRSLGIFMEYRHPTIPRLKKWEPSWWCLRAVLISTSNCPSSCQRMNILQTWSCWASSTPISILRTALTHCQPLVQGTYPSWLTK